MLINGYKNGDVNHLGDGKKTVSGYLHGTLMG